MQVLSWAQHHTQAQSWASLISNAQDSTLLLYDSSKLWAGLFHLMSSSPFYIVVKGRISSFMARRYSIASVLLLLRDTELVSWCNKCGRHLRYHESTSFHLWAPMWPLTRRPGFQIWRNRSPFSYSGDIILIPTSPQNFLSPHPYQPSLLFNLFNKIYSNSF